MHQENILGELCEDDPHVDPEDELVVYGDQTLEEEDSHIMNTSLLRMLDGNFHNKMTANDSGKKRSSEEKPLLISAETQLLNEKPLESLFPKKPRKSIKVNGPVRAFKTEVLDPEPEDTEPKVSQTPKISNLKRIDSKESVTSK